ncbi:MAG: hypothetical protein QME27_07395 [Syntrophaceae bacterium]|nr:hypothetical protein [Syntrophaceae bacterium]
MNDHPSDSLVQETAEVELLRLLSKKLGYVLVPHKIKLNQKSSIQIDGFSCEGRILCEVYAHIGALRGGQPDKIAADILKLNLSANRKGGQWRKILLFADETACRHLRGASWLAEACSDSGIEIEVADINQDMKEKIATAQQRQKMVNAE